MVTRYRETEKSLSPVSFIQAIILLDYPLT